MILENEEIFVCGKLCLVVVFFEFINGKLQCVCSCILEALPLPLKGIEFRWLVLVLCQNPVLCELFGFKKSVDLQTSRYSNDGVGFVVIVIVVFVFPLINFCFAKL